MALHLEIVDFDEMYHTSSIAPTLLNAFNIDSEEDKERLNKQIYTSYEGDSLEVLPSCECGNLRGEYNVDIPCPICNTQVMSVTERPLEATLWMAPPKGVLRFINPQVWAILSNALTYAGSDLLEYLVNPSYQLPPNQPKAAKKLLTLDLERGINYFYTHFDHVMGMLFQNGIINGTRQARDNLKTFLSIYRDRLFCQWMPIPSKLGFITEQTVTGTYADPTIKDAIDAIRTISATENAVLPLSLRTRQSRAMKANALLSNYHQQFVAVSLGGKFGWFRKHVFGSRSHFTMRAVITSLSENHDRRECHLPWSVSVMAYKVHLTSKLIKRGFTPGEANKLLNENTRKYHPLLDELFQELIAECLHMGLPIILQRNPSLQRGSAQLFYVTKIKTDPNINTISMSTLTLKAPNADELQSRPSVMVE
jgi:hypothetical protein